MNINQKLAELSYENEVLREAIRQIFVYTFLSVGDDPQKAVRKSIEALAKIANEVEARTPRVVLG